MEVVSRVIASQWCVARVGWEEVLGFGFVCVCVCLLVRLCVESGQGIELEYLVKWAQSTVASCQARDARYAGE